MSSCIVSGMDTQTPLPTVAEINAAVQRVRSLTDEARQHFVYALLGRMLVLDYDAVMHDLADAEATE